MNGYAGRVLHVNLTEGEIETKPLDMDIAQSYIGDLGLGFRTVYDLQGPGVDPLSPDNVLSLSVGPLVGSQLGTRFSCVCRYPLTGAVAFGSGGMSFGPRLKWAGYDQVVITGRSPKPVYLRISDDRVELRDAGELWGKDTVDTTDALWKKHGRLNGIVAIGTAGENLVPMSVALVDKCASLGKGGLPALMGSKNLKAVVVRGSKPISLADPERFKKLRDEILVECEEGGGRTWIKVGKLWFTIMWGFKLAINNYTQMFPSDKSKALYGEKVYLKEILGKRIGCPGCPYPCKDVISLHGGPFDGMESTISSLGGFVGNLGVQTGGGVTFKETIKLSDVLNRLGVDRHTFAGVVNLTFELYQRGIITKEDTGGLELTPSFDTCLTLLNQIATRQGIGDVLADGVKGVVNRYGKEVEQYSCHIKNMDQEMDARQHDFNMAVFCQVTNPEGASWEPAHVGSNWFPHTIKTYDVIEQVQKFCKRMDMPDETIEKIFDFPEGCYSTPITTRWGEDFYSALTALGTCEYRTEFMNWERFAGLYSAATGIEVSADHMKKVGERIWNLFKALNMREGFDRKDDRFPPKWIEPLKDAEGKEIPLATCEGRPVTMETFNTMLDEYYEERGWDIQTGNPTTEKLEELDLGDVADDLHKQGFI